MIDRKIPVVILCGGTGTRMKEETEYRPKPMVMVGDKPLLLHIMNIYAYYGFKNFILPLGYKGWMIKEYFLNYNLFSNDIRLSFNACDKCEVSTITHNSCLDYTIDFVETGIDTLTAKRLKMLESHIDGMFLMTYGDGVCDVDIDKLINFHLSHGKTVTVTGVREPARFGDIYQDNGRVVAFHEKVARGDKLTNGGFYVVNKNFFDFIEPETNYKLELEPLQKIIDSGELMVYKHDGRWQCADVVREVELLNDLYNQGEAFWIK